MKRKHGIHDLSSDSFWSLSQVSSVIVVVVVFVFSVVTFKCGVVSSGVSRVCCVCSSLGGQHAKQ